MNFKKWMLKKVLLLSFIFIPILLTGGCSLAPSLPEPKIPEGSKIYDSNGHLITNIYKEKRTAIPIDKIPETTQQAIISVEDSRFYEHSGVSFIGIARAAVKNLQEGAVVEGGSTITQQTVKNLYLTNDRTFARKVIELWYAIQLERQYTKDEILEMYLNQIYFGEGAYGIEEAAQTYFGKSASQLNLAEGALLAGLPKAPSRYSPFVNWEAAKDRQKVVLQRMVVTGAISEEAADKAAQEEITLNSNRRTKGQAAYFVDEIIKVVSEKYEDGANLLLTGGLKIETTLNLNMQKAAEAAFAKRMEKQEPGLDGGLVAVEPQTGYVVAMVGGRSYTSSKFNRALQAKRQPGSAFKPFVYAAAIDQGYSAGSTITCEPAEFQTGSETYRPTDYGNQEYHYRPFTLKEAVQISDNVVAVKLASEIGPQTVIDYASKMGITSPLRPYLSIALGTSEVSPLEMATAYATLANGGFRVKPIFIKKITNNQGQVLEDNQPVRNKVLDAKTAYILTDILKSVVRPGGTASIVEAILARPAAGKTGTTQNYADAWFVGYTPDLAAAVYVGYDSSRKSVGSTGGHLAAPIWADFTARALKDKEPSDFTQPQGLVQKSICADTGLLATPYSEKVLTAYFVVGTEPTEQCPVHGGWLPSPFERQQPDDFEQDPQDEEYREENENRWPGDFPRGRKRFFDWFVQP